MAANNQNQSRFFLAIVLSLGVLLLWGFLFPPPRPNQNANTANAAQQANATTQTIATPEVAPQQLQQVQAPSPTDAPNRILTIKTPLYEAKFDSRGALITSWILYKNVSREGEEKPLFSAASVESNKLPLELISTEAVNRRELPLKLVTGDANFDALLNTRSYQIVNVENDEIALNGNESQKIDFVLRDEANQTEVVKSLTFYANSYITDLQTVVKRSNQIVPNTKLQIGASIGDQGIKRFDYYQIEPESVSVVNGDVERHLAASFVGQNNGRMVVNGTIDWTGIGDTYFAMIAVPTQPTSGLEIQASKYEVRLPEPRVDGIWGFLTGAKVEIENRHLISALLPIASDGSNLTKLYVGTKDHYLLNNLSGTLSQQLGRTIDLESFINYGWFPSLVRPISIPILWSLNRLNALTSNYGVAILVFTFLFFSILFPMRWYQSKSFKKAAKNAPKMKELQEKYKEYQAKKIPLDDPRMRELQMEQLKLTKDAVPLGGCLPLLLQFPLLIAVYTAITISLDFRQATFLWLPDLSAGDPFHVLEFLFAGSMGLAMMFTPTAPAVTPEQQMQQKMMTYFMPVMMLWVMWGAPSGLLVYWLAGNIIGFGQQLLINRMNKVGDEPPTATTTNEKDRPLTKKERMKTSLSTS